MLILQFFLCLSAVVFASKRLAKKNDAPRDLSPPFRFLSLPFRSMDSCDIFHEVPKNELVQRVHSIMKDAWTLLINETKKYSEGSETFMRYTALREALEIVKESQGNLSEAEIMDKWIDAIKTFLEPLKMSSNNFNHLEVASKLLAPIIARSNANDRRNLFTSLLCSDDLEATLKRLMKMEICKMERGAKPLSNTVDLGEWAFLERIIPEPVLEDKILQELELPFEKPPCEAVSIADDQLYENTLNAFLAGIAMLKNNPDLYKKVLSLTKNAKTVKEKVSKLLALALFLESDKPAKFLVLSPVIARATFKDMRYLANVLGKGKEDDWILTLLYHVKSKFICKCGDNLEYYRVNSSPIIRPNWRIEEGLKKHQVPSDSDVEGFIRELLEPLPMEVDKSTGSLPTEEGKPSARWQRTMAPSRKRTTTPPHHYLTKRKPRSEDVPTKSE